MFIDSTGFKSEGEGKWNARKQGGPKRQSCRKIHIGINEETLEVRAVEITTSNMGDAPMLPELLTQTPPDQDIGSVTAHLSRLLRNRLSGNGWAYDMRKCREAIASQHARMLSLGSRRAPELLPETTQLMPSDTGVVHCGDAGADATEEAASKPRCTV